MDQLVCLGVPPAPVYKGARGGGRPAPIGAPGGVLLLVGVGLLLGGGKEGEEGEGNGDAAPPSLVQFGPEGEGRAAFPGRPSMARQGGVLLLVGVGVLLGGGKKWGGRGKGGRRPPSPSPIQTRGRRRAAHPGCPSLSPLRPIWPITSPEGFR